MSREIGKKDHAEVRAARPVAVVSADLSRSVALLVVLVLLITVTGSGNF